MAPSKPSSSSAAAPPPPPTTPPPPPPPAQKGFLRRIFPFLLAVNLAVGVYVLVRTSQKQSSEKDAEKKVDAAESKESTISEKTFSTAPVPAPVFEHPPIPEDQQRELFKWILEEKRKVKPRDKAEKKKIDEEKALLKEFIRAKSIPNI